MIITFAVMLVLSILGGFVYGGVSQPNDFITFGILRSIEGFVGAIIPTTVVTIFFGIIKSIYKKDKKYKKDRNKTY